MRISSIKNNLIKFIYKLKKKKNRKYSKLFLVEGEKEIGIALKANFVPKYVLVCKDIGNSGWILAKFNKYQIININKLIFKKIAYRKTSGGILAIF
ncbi:hypothetical protein ACWNYL_00060 [Candidatus Karelsulcia muelleri]